MKLKPLILSLGLLLWVSEPFLTLAVPPPSHKPSVCSTCGMKDKCGTVCCCSNTKTVDPDCYRKAPGLYAPGCSPDESAGRFLGQTIAKWFPPANPRVAPIPAARNFPSVSSSPTSPASEIPTPPPESGFLS